MPARPSQSFPRTPPTNDRVFSSKTIYKRAGASEERRRNLGRAERATGTACEEPVELESIRGRALTESQIARLLRETTSAPQPGQHTPALHKYESDGGPGIERIMDVLSGSARAVQDRRQFFLTQMIFWLLAATDGHTKKFSIAHLPGNEYQSTPLYDVLSAHPVIGTGRDRFAAQRVIPMDVADAIFNGMRRLSRKLAS